MSLRRTRHQHQGRRGARSASTCSRSLAHGLLGDARPLTRFQHLVDGLQVAAPPCPPGAGEAVHV